jgi:hypothetical protein
MLHVDAVALTVSVSDPLPWWLLHRARVPALTLPVRRCCGLLLWVCPADGCEHAGGLHETGYVHPDGHVRPLPPVGASA